MLYVRFNVELWIQTRIATTFQYDILCVLTLNLKTTGRIWTFQHMEQLHYYWRCVLSVLELDARYDWQVMAPNMHSSVFLLNHCAYLHM